jgi:TolB-like protein
VFPASENLNEEKANAFFADGVQDQILTALAKVADLKVISRTSVMHIRPSKTVADSRSSIADRRNCIRAIQHATSDRSWEVLDGWSKSWDD